MAPRASPSRRGRTLSLAYAAAFASSSCVYARVMYFAVPDLSTRLRFDARPVPATHPVPLPLARRRLADNTFPLTPEERARFGSFDRMIQSGDTRAFLVVHDDAVVFERYFHGTSPETLLPGFSITKTYAALFTGVALADGTLGSTTDSIVTYLPELARRPRYPQVTLDSLLRMTSGIDYREESVDGAAMYYTTDLRSRMYGYSVRHEPGTHYEYGSVNVMLLWDAIHRRLGGSTVSEAFARDVWGPLGATSDAEWSLDSAESGIEKFFGGFNATARDHARLGLLYLHGGELNGRRVVPREWVDRSLAPDPVAGVVHTKDGDVRRGCYQWFLTLDGRAYFAKGYHGQYIFVVPDRSAVFVRFGEGYGDVDWPNVFVRMADAMPTPR